MKINHTADSLPRLSISKGIEKDNLFNLVSKFGNDEWNEIGLIVVKRNYKKDTSCKNTHGV